MILILNYSVSMYLTREINTLEKTLSLWLFHYFITGNSKYFPTAGRKRIDERKKHGFLLLLLLLLPPEPNFSFLGQVELPNLFLFSK